MARDPEERRAYNRAHYQRNKAEIRARQAAYYEQHRDEILDQQHGYRLANAERIKEYDRQRRNPVAAAARNARWNATEKGKATRVASSARRRAIKAGADHGCCTPGSLQRVWERCEGLCVYCAAEGQHFDHVVALARGGQHCLANLVLACGPCNSRKGTTLVEDFVGADRAASLPRTTCEVT